MPIFSVPSLSLLGLCLLFWLVAARLSARPKVMSTPWHVVQGTISACWRDELDNPDDEAPGDWWVQASYNWQGRAYSVDDVADESDDLDQFRSGSLINIWIHPDNPADAAIHNPADGGAPPNWRALVAVSAASWLLLLALISMLV
jgi:hypothetical protein